MALYPLVLDVLRTACYSQAQVQKGIIMDAPVKVKQELKMTPLLSPALVDQTKVKEALKSAPKVVKVMTQPSPKLWTSEPSSPSTSQPKSKSFAHQMSVPMVFSKKKGKPSATTAKDSTKPCPFPGHKVSERKDGLSSHEASSQRLFT